MNGISLNDVSLEQYQRTEREAAAGEARTGFVAHAVITALVMVGLVVLNVTVADEFPWSIFPVVGMGIGLLAHWWFGYRQVEKTVRQHQFEVERRALETTVR